jgi:hypothetical protein
MKMKKAINWKRIIYVIGVVALIIGAADPMEGSVVIAAGSLLTAVSTFFMRDRHWRIFMACMILILTGVYFLFFLSSLGGFGGSSDLSWWWGVFILPYPVGWLTLIVLLTIRAFKSSPLKADRK